MLESEAIKLALDYGVIQSVEPDRYRFTDPFLASLKQATLELDATNTDSDYAGLGDIAILATVIHNNTRSKTLTEIFPIAKVVYGMLRSGLSAA